MNFTTQLLSDLSSDDLKSIQLIDSVNFPFPWTLEHWQLASETNNYRIFMGEDLSCFSLFQVSIEDEFSHLLKIIVIPVKRSVGLGEALLDYSEVALRNLGVTRSYLEVDTLNEPAKRLYLKSNYKVIHTKAKFYSNGADAHIMEKSLIS